MNTWWSSMQMAEQVFWLIAIPSTVLLAIQLVMTIVGLSEHHGDVGADTSDVHSGHGGHHDHDGEDDSSDDASDGETASVFKPFTVKNMIVFFACFGWIGIAALRSGWSLGVASFCGFIAGILGILALGLAMLSLNKLRESGNINVKNAIGAVGTAYLRIPGKRSGNGIIQISIQGAIREYDALTDGDEIKTGEHIKVLSLINEHTMLVAKQ